MGIVIKDKKFTASLLGTDKKDVVKQDAVKSEVLWKNDLYALKNYVFHLNNQIDLVNKKIDVAQKTTHIDVHRDDDGDISYIRMDNIIAIVNRNEDGKITSMDIMQNFLQSRETPQS